MAGSMPTAASKVNEIGSLSSMNGKLNIGVVGLEDSAASTLTFANRLPDANLVAVSDVRQEVAQQIAREYGAKSWYQDYKDLIADEDVEAVVIVTPTKFHTEVAVQAARAGKKIFCEKPLSLSIEGSVEIKDVVEETGVFFQTCGVSIADTWQPRRKPTGRDRQSRTIQIDLTRSRATDLDYLRPENSGGLFVDMGIHDFDLARWLMGEVKSVYATGGVLAYPEMSEIGDVDAIVNLYFEDGTIGAIDLSRNAIYGYEICSEILGSNGALQIGYHRETPLQVMKANEISHDVVPGFYERFQKAYIAQLQNFVDNVLGDRLQPSRTMDSKPCLSLLRRRSPSTRTGPSSYRSFDKPRLYNSGTSGT